MHHKHFVVEKEERIIGIILSANVAAISEFLSCYSFSSKIFYRVLVNFIVMGDYEMALTELDLPKWV